LSKTAVNVKLINNRSKGIWSSLMSLLSQTLGMNYVWIL
jgi:hypothetical protein